MILSLDKGKWNVDTFECLPEGVQPQISVQELIDCEKVVKNNKRVQQLAKDVGKVICHLFFPGFFTHDIRSPS